MRYEEGDTYEREKRKLHKETNKEIKAKLERESLGTETYISFK
jgi:hypothetical protein